MILTPDRRRTLSAALVALTRAAEPIERAHLLSQAAHELFDVGTAVVILAEDGQVEAVAGSDEGCRQLAELERDGVPGPALECARSGGPRSHGRDLDSAFSVSRDSGCPHGQEAWARTAAGLGWTQASAVPLTAGGPAVGGLVLLTRDGDAQAPGYFEWAVMLAAVAAAGMERQRELALERTANEQLKRALTSRVIIEQAKGVLAERGGVDPTTAFARMRRYSRAQRRRLHDVALDVVRGAIADAVLTYTGTAVGPHDG
jgi:hypothetical protein